jgi:hypothetical protein
MDTIRPCSAASGLRPHTILQMSIKLAHADPHTPSLIQKQMVDSLKFDSKDYVCVGNGRNGDFADS